MNENKFTPTAEEALRLAQEAAGELGHGYVGTEQDRKSTRLNSSHSGQSRMPSSA